MGLKKKTRMFKCTIGKQGVGCVFLDTTLAGNYCEYIDPSLLNIIVPVLLVQKSKVSARVNLGALLFNIDIIQIHNASVAVD